MIELGKAGGKFSAAASRPGHNSQRFCHLDILVGAVTFLADDGLNICRITLCVKMFVGLYIPFFQPVYELVDSRGILVARDDYAVYLQVMFAENINKPEYFQIICNAKILACLAVDYVSGVYADCLLYTSPSPRDRG